MIEYEHDPGVLEEWLWARRGRLAIDVGANVGRVAERLAGAYDEVLAYEPAEESFDTLVAVANRCPNISAYEMALSDRQGKVELVEQEHPIRSGQLTSGGCPHWGEEIARRTVPCTTLDAVWDEYADPDLVKIDVEGHDERVVRGGLKMLTEVTPSLYIEVHDKAQGETIERLLEPAYGDRLHHVVHPGYSPGDWGYENHWFLIAE